MTRPVHTLLAAMTMAAILSGPAAAATCAQAPGSVVKLGDYERLTFIRQMKLGAAEFVNPKLLSTSALVYRYELRKLSGEANAEAFLKLLSDGSGALATVSGSQFSILNIKPTALEQAIVPQAGSPSPDALDVLARKLAAASGEAAEGPITFVATTPEIGSIPASGRLISWSAIHPVSLPASVGCAPTTGAP